jgi:acetoin utilization deacetylase AcuC-like enzyme
VWHHDAYRLRCGDACLVAGIEPRRAELALWALEARGWARCLDVRAPEPVSWRDLARVHTPAWLEEVTRPETLSRVFGADDPRFPVDAVLDTVRRAVQGTVDAARASLADGRPTINLLGGFHHAFPDRGGGLCPLNDVAVALAVLRSEGFDGEVLVLDLDAHPPDGTDAALASDTRASIASISCAFWAPLQRVDEVVLPAGTEDAAYLRALGHLLGRHPKPALAFVLAGSDVRAQDRMGTFALSDEGVRRRDHIVSAWLGDTPAVWLPAGGYRPDAWRPLAEQALLLLDPEAGPLPVDLDPLAARFAWVGRHIDPSVLAGDEDEDEDPLLGVRAGPKRYLGWYTLAGLEVALEQYGVMQHIRDYGYTDLELSFAPNELGDRLRLEATGGGARHLLVESVLEVQEFQGRRWLFVHWLTLRHPLGRWRRAPLPGQDAPGLGLGREAIELLHRMADRLGLAGVMFRPAHAHVAIAASIRFRFVDPAVQGRFEALLRDLGELGPAELSRQVADGAVRCQDLPWSWVAEPMVDAPADADAQRVIATTRQSSRFRVADPE